jgi:hypothetical protein
MSPWFRRRRQAEASAPRTPEAAPEQPNPEPEEPQEELDPTGPLTPDRLDSALKRLRQEIPAPSGESPPWPSE